MGVFAVKNDVGIGTIVGEPPQPALSPCRLRGGPRCFC